MFSILKPFLFNLDPETAHDLAIKSLKFDFIPEKFFKVENEEILETTFLKRKINNPIGLAAGFDKSAEVYKQLSKLGFGLIEVGTVTPEKQFGNPKPRIFRLEEDEALINRLGFNNDGLETIVDRLDRRIDTSVALGVNIGPNYDSSSYEYDFLKCFYNIMKYALKYFEDIVKPNKKYRKPNVKEKKALLDLVKRLKDCKDQMDPEAIQTIVYSVGKDNGYQENLREWFKAIYEIIFGDQDGPRMGFFISFFGIKESIELINKYIK